jgi:hypothetical protein
MDRHYEAYTRYPQLCNNHGCLDLTGLKAVKGSKVLKHATRLIGTKWPFELAVLGDNLVVSYFSAKLLLQVCDFFYGGQTTKF